MHSGRRRGPVTSSRGGRLHGRKEIATTAPPPPPVVSSSFRFHSSGTNTHAMTKGFFSWKNDRDVTYLLEKSRDSRGEDGRAERVQRPLVLQRQSNERQNEWQWTSKCGRGKKRRTTALVSPCLGYALHSTSGGLLWSVYLQVTVLPFPTNLVPAFSLCCSIFVLGTF